MTSPDPATGLDTPDPGLASLPPRIVFYDGVCVFCEGLVPWIFAHDPGERLHFAPLQGETAARVRDAFPESFPSDVDTVLLYERDEHSLVQRAEAIFRVAELLEGRWRHVARLRALPDWLMELAYRAFAASRYRLFGRLDACPIPTDAERRRLLP
jgi:predicted DCC family thiol-disulfide oxidoreductase YuxK